MDTYAGSYSLRLSGSRGPSAAPGSVIQCFGDELAVTSSDCWSAVHGTSKAGRRSVRDCRFVRVCTPALWLEARALQLAFVREGQAQLREHMAQVCIQAVDSNSVPDEKPSVGEMGTSHEKRMSTSRSQGACAWTESQFWKMDLPCTVLFARRSLRGSHAAVKFLGTESYM